MYDYILDGTNICHVGSSQGPSLLPVFQIVQHLLAEEKSFICVFDGNTFKDHLTDDLEKATFAAITVRPGLPYPLFAKGCFRQVQGKKADEEVLAKAQQNEEAYVISADRFDEPSYERNYGWTDQQRKVRLLTIYEHEGKLTLTKINGSVHATIPPAAQPQTLFEAVINHIEAEQGRLQGRIVDLDMGKRIGRIHRRYAGNVSVMFHESGLADQGLRFDQCRDEEVSFRIAAYYQSGKKRQPGRWGFQAQEIVPSPSAETLLESQQRMVTELERKLKQANATRETQAEKLAGQAAQIELLSQELNTAQTQTASEAMRELRQQHEQLQGEYGKLETEYEGALARLAELEAELERLRKQTHEREEELQTQLLLIGTLEEEKAQLEQMLEVQAEAEDGELQEAYHSLQFDYQSLRQMWRQEQVRVKMLRRLMGPTNGQSQELTEGVEVELAKMRHEIELLRQQNEELRKEMHAMSHASSEPPPERPASPEPPVAPLPPLPPHAPQHLTTEDWGWWLGFSEDLRRYFAFKYLMAWDAPDPDALQELRLAETLNLSGPSNALERTQNIPQISDLKGLSRLEQLRVVNLSHHQIESVAELLSLKRLEELHLTDNQVRSVAGIEGLTRLRELYIDQNLLTNLLGLERLPMLEDLNVRGNPGLPTGEIDRLDAEKLNPNLLIRR